MGYMNIRPYKPRSEKELHALIKTNLDKLNLKLVQYEFKQGSDIPDFLCIDEECKLTVIEVKLGVDKNIILQGMRYYKMADKEIVKPAKLRMFFPQELDALLYYNGFIIDYKYGTFDEKPFNSDSNWQIVICHKK